MADNLKNIEDALGKIQSDSNFIKGRIDDNFDEKTSAINKSLVDFANAITRAWSNTSTGKTKSSPVKLDWTKFDRAITKFGNDLDNYSKNISEPVTKLNDSVVEANLYLKTIANHISNQASTGTTGQQGQSTSGGGGNKKGADGIHSTVKEILDVLKLIQSGQKTGNAAADDAIAEAAKLHAENQQTQERYVKALQQDPKELKKILNGKRNDQEAQQLRAAYEAKQNEKKNKEREGRGIKDHPLTKAVESVLGIGKTFLSTEKVSFDKVADATIGAVKNIVPGIAGSIIGGLLEAVKTAFDIGAREQRMASDFSRSIGGGRTGMRNAQMTARSILDSERLKELGYSVEEAYSAMTVVSESLGRTAEHLNRRDLESAINLRRFGIGGQEINNFDTFGKSLQETDRFFTQLYSSVSKKGLSFKNVSKAVNDNLKMAQTHTFANGLRGLEAMAEKSVQLKYNMQQVSAFSDKVSTVEGALQTSANLSVLGGAFAQYSDPMQLLYESLNDQEAMNDRMIEMFGKSAFWDSTKGEFSMAPEDRMRLKAAAQAAGLNPNEMLNLAYNNARVSKVETQIGTGIGGDTAEYIKNIASLDKNGTAYVTLNGERRNVSDLSDADKAALQKESERKELSENADLGSVYAETMSIGEKLDKILEVLQQKIYLAIYKGLDWISGGFLSEAVGDTDMGESAGNSRRGWLGRAMRGTIGYANGYSPNDADILSNVPGNGTIGGSYHSDGGTPVLAEKDEFIMNRISSGVYKKELEAMQRLAYNPSVQPYARNADTSTVMSLSKVSSTERQPATAAQQAQSGNVSGTIKVDIPQTITLNLSGAGQIGQYDISGIIKKYVDSFMKEAQIRQSFGGFDKENFYNQSTVI